MPHSSLCLLGLLLQVIGHGGTAYHGEGARGSRSVLTNVASFWCPTDTRALQLLRLRGEKAAMRQALSMRKVCIMYWARGTGRRMMTQILSHRPESAQKCPCPHPQVLETRTRVRHADQGQGTPTTARGRHQASPGPRLPVRPPQPRRGLTLPAPPPQCPGRRAPPTDITGSKSSAHDAAGARSGGASADAAAAR